jgi:20S proteasome subunit alpha 3
LHCRSLAHPRCARSAALAHPRRARCACVCLARRAGANSTAAQSILKADYREDLTLDEALRLAVKVLSKTMDATLLSGDKLELSAVSRAPSGEVVYHVYTPAELEPLTAAVNAAAAAEEQAKAAEAAAAKKH